MKSYRNISSCSSTSKLTKQWWTHVLWGSTKKTLLWGLNSMTIRQRYLLQMSTMTITLSKVQQANCHHWHCQSVHPVRSEDSRGLGASTRLWALINPCPLGWMIPHLVTVKSLQLRVAVIAVAKTIVQIPRMKLRLKWTWTLKGKLIFKLPKIDLTKKVSGYMTNMSSKLTINKCNSRLIEMI